MKIGIMTYHRAENYGSVLQAYALSTTIKKLGHDPEIIDYHSEAQDKMFQLYNGSHSLGGTLRNLLAFVYQKKLKAKKESFSSFLKNRVQLSRDDYNDRSDLSVLNSEYDFFICGSDQVWNTACTDYTDAYLLDFAEKKQCCMSFAASIGVSRIKPEEEEKFKTSISGFKYISVRERTAKECLERILERKVDVVPDPVVLLSKEEWDDLAADNRFSDYILCYFIGDAPRMREFAKRMHKLSGLPLVFTNFSLRDTATAGYKAYDTGPQEFISLIKNAKYICTDSFHAVLFSLIYHKNFWVFTKLNKGSSRSRIDDIAFRVSLTDRVLNTDKELPDDPLCDIDYTGVDPIVEEYAGYGYSRLKENTTPIDNDS
ncbi:MAG: polysaccharide pyruvyl transferase family protein [Ruminococcus sp.]|nr:polysaccharide pyruvyl transferase family protein [Ruminococcus sp.]